MASQPNRVVLITGAGGGIGSVMTQALLEAGHSVASVDTDVGWLTALDASPIVDKNRDRWTAVVADLSDESQCNDAVAQTIAKFGRVDAVVNNVGIGPSSIGPQAEKNPPQIEDITTEVWDQFFAVNVRAAMLVTRAAMPAMRKAKWGRIVNNTTSYVTMLRILPYGATKSALESMSAVWATQLRDTGVTVNVLVPGGPTDTRFISQESGWPRDKMLKPQIMGPPLVWLISDEANGFTGHHVTAADWNSALPGAEAAKGASRPTGWPELATLPKWWPTN